MSLSNNWLLPSPSPSPQPNTYTQCRTDSQILHGPGTARIQVFQGPRVISSEAKPREASSLSCEPWHASALPCTQVWDVSTFAGSDFNLKKVIFSLIVLHSGGLVYGA